VCPLNACWNNFVRFLLCFGRVSNGLCTECLIESKASELAVEGNSSRVQFLKVAGALFAVLLGRADCRGLLATIEELLRERGLRVLWRKSKTSFPTILAQRCSNKHRRFVVVEHGGGRRRGPILVQEGRDGVGWRKFAAKLHLIVNFLHSILECCGQEHLMSCSSPGRGGT
jgi:hypothetical protein